MFQRLAAKATSLTQQYLPAPYLFSLLLTFLAATLAIFVTRTALADLVGYWYGGLWEILTFTTQMVLVLMCGHALVDAPAVKRVLDWISGLPRTERQAAHTQGGQYQEISAIYGGFQVIQDRDGCEAMTDPGCARDP